MPTIKQFLDHIDNTLGSEDPIPADYGIDGMILGENPLHVICRAEREEDLDALYGLSIRSNFLELFQQNSGGPDTSPFHVLQTRERNGEIQPRPILNFLEGLLGNIAPQPTFPSGTRPESLGLIQLEPDQPLEPNHPSHHSDSLPLHPGVSTEPSSPLLPGYGRILGSHLQYDITLSLKNLLKKSLNPGLQLLLSDMQKGDLKIITGGENGIKLLRDDLYELKHHHAYASDMRIIGSKVYDTTIIFYYLTNHAGLSRSIPALPTHYTLFGESKGDLRLSETESSSSTFPHAPGKSPPRNEKIPTKTPIRTKDSNGGRYTLEDFKKAIRGLNLVNIYAEDVLRNKSDQVASNHLPLAQRAKIVFTEHLNRLEADISESLIRASLKLHHDHAIDLHNKIQMLGLPTLQPYFAALYPGEILRLPSSTAASSELSDLSSSSSSTVAVVAPPMPVTSSNGAVMPMQHSIHQSQKQFSFTSGASDLSSSSSSTVAVVAPPMPVTSSNGAVMPMQHSIHQSQKQFSFTSDASEIVGAVILYTKDDVCFVLGRTILNKYITVPCSHSFPTEMAWGALYYSIHFGALFSKTHSFLASTIFASIKTSSYVLPRMISNTQTQAPDVNIEASAAFGFAIGIFTQSASNFLLINVMPQIAATIGLSVVVTGVTLTTDVWQTGAVTAATFVAHDLLKTHSADQDYNPLILGIPPILAGFAALYFGFGILGALHVAHLSFTAIGLAHVSRNIAKTETFLKLITLGNLDEVKTFAANYPEMVNKQDANGVTPLLHAVLAQKHQVVKFLLEAGADPNVGDAKHQKPIHAAASMGSSSESSSSVMLDLVLYKADINVIIPPDNVTAIDIALKSNHINVAIFLISIGANFNISHVLSLPPQRRNSEYRVFSKLVARLQNHLTAKDNVRSVINVCNALYTLQQKGEKLNDSWDSWNKTCIGSIIRARGPDDTDAALCAKIQFSPQPNFCSKAELKSTTTPNKSDSEVETETFMQLIASGNLGAVRMFAAEHPGVVHRKDKQDLTPLEKAIIHDQMAIFLWLLDAKVSVNEAEADGNTALNVAARFLYAEKYMKPLLEAGADPNMGNTFKALHLVAHSGLISAIELLLSYGADINAIAPPSSYNASAIDAALVTSHPEAATFLVSRGACLNVSNFLSVSPQTRVSAGFNFQEFITHLQSYVKSAKDNVSGVINVCNALYVLQKGTDLGEWKAECAASIARTRGPDDTNDKLCAEIQFPTERDFCEIAGEITNE